jgi:hypothetical protein
MGTLSTSDEGVSNSEMKRFSTIVDKAIKDSCKPHEKFDVNIIILSTIHYTVSKNNDRFLLPIIKACKDKADEIYDIFLFIMGQAMSTDILTSENIDIYDLLIEKINKLANE